MCGCAVLERAGSAGCISLSLHQVPPSALYLLRPLCIVPAGDLVTAAWAGQLVVGRQAKEITPQRAAGVAVMAPFLVQIRMRWAEAN